MVRNIAFPQVQDNPGYFLPAGHAMMAVPVWSHGFDAVRRAVIVIKTCRIFDTTRSVYK